MILQKIGTGLEIGETAAIIIVVLIGGAYLYLITRR
jgi:hypothetical protein